MKYFLVLGFFFPLISFAQTKYVVRKGDTLLTIADRELDSRGGKKDPRRYEMAKKIRAANPQIQNPNILEPGDVINLPKEMSLDSEEKIITEKKPPAVEIVAQNIEETAVVEPAHEVAPAVSDVVAGHAAPAAKEVAHEDAHHSEHHDFIVLQPRFQILKFGIKDDATKETAHIESGSSIGLDLQYGKILSADFHLLLHAGFTQTSFKDFSEAGATIDKKSKNQTVFGLGLAYDISSNLHFDVMAVAADRSFILPTAPLRFELKSIMIPGGEVNLSWDYYSGASSLLGLSLIGEYIGQATKDNIKYKSVFEPMGALYWKTKKPGFMNYKAALTYKNGHQENTLAEQHEEAYILALSFIF